MIRIGWSCSPWLLAAALLVGAGCDRGDDDDSVVEHDDENPCAGDAVLTLVGDTLSFNLADCASVAMTATVEGDGGLLVELVEDAGAVRPVVTATDDATFRGLSLTGSLELAGTNPVRLWRQGYQSWSFSGVVETEPVDFDGLLPAAGGDGDSTSVFQETPWSSWWVGLVGRSDGASLLLGAESVARTKFYVSTDGSQAWAVWGHRGEQITLAAGEQLELDPLHIRAGDQPYALHRAYAEAVVARVGGPELPSLPPTGWATWYQFYAEVTEEDVRANLDFAAAPGDGLAPLEVFQIDDGWQQLWGAWTANEDFPSGMQTLAADITTAGLTPGLWMAPFYVHRDTDTYQQNPDWWVRDLDGTEIAFDNIGTGDYAVVDATHPEAGAWMAQQVADRVTEGWTYLKLDFLYAGAQEGMRHEDVTGVEAYHRGLALLRQAAGDSWVLACGAPLLPTVGYAESYRTGADIAFGGIPDPQPEFLRWQARATAARSWANGILWWGDPDQLLVRDPFDDVQARGSIAAQVVSGGPWLLGDDLPALDDQLLAWALAPDIVALRGLDVEPRAPLAHVSGIDAGPMVEMVVADDHVPTRWQVGEHHVVLLNMDEAPVTEACPGGTELLTGATCDAGDDRALAAGAGEIWQLPSTER
jgi:hypothetical protein